MARCRTSGQLKGLFTPLEPRIFWVQYPPTAKGPLTCEDMTEREYVSVDPGLAGAAAAVATASAAAVATAHEPPS
jgi:hypothetical protein